MPEENNNHLLELYKLFRAETHKSIDLHAQHFSKFLTLIAALLGSTLAGIHYFGDSPCSQAFLSLLGGTLSVLVSLIGMEMCNRFYEGMLEAITVTAKLEALLGFENMPKPTGGLRPLNAFNADQHLMPSRWIRSRASYSTSDQFITESINKGSNRYVKYTLYALAIFSLFFVTFGILRIVFLLSNYCKIC